MRLFLNMALILYPDGVIKSGKAGGNVYQKNGIFKSNRYATPTSSKQSDVHSLMASFAALWRSLPSGTRELWAEAAANRPPRLNRFSQPRLISPFSFYMSYMFNFYNRSGGDVYQTITGIAPVFPPSPPENPTVVASATHFTYTLTGDTYAFLIELSTAAGANYDYLVYASPVLSAGVSNPGANYRLIDVQAGNDFGGGISFLNAFQDVYGVLPPPVTTPLEGDILGKVFVRLVPISGGDASAISLITLPITVIA